MLEVCVLNPALIKLLSCRRRPPVSSSRRWCHTLVF